MHHFCQTFSGAAEARAGTAAGAGYSVFAIWILVPNHYKLITKYIYNTLEMLRIFGI